MNLKNLAKTLGVSKTTVSRALNGYPEVSERTRERVLAAAAAAGYRPHPVARSLAVGRTNVVGIVYPLLPSDLGDPMFVSVVGGMSAALEQQRQYLVIVPASPDNELRAYEHIVQGRRVDALVVSRTRLHDLRIEYLSQQGMPFVAHGRCKHPKPYAWFDYDNEAGIQMATQYLLAHGHTRIGFIGATQEMTCSFQRRHSFMQTMRAAGLPVDPRYLVDDALDRRSGYSAAQQLLECAPRPTAIIVDNHLCGVGVIRAVLDAGLELGRDISVIVWGRLEDSLVSHRVATIDQPEPARAGAKMIEMLLSLIKGTPPEQLQELWSPSLIPGETVGYCRQ
ncbi:MAG TPA: substrate-binding domain-containing protein [Noviherbaspirillum sp.]